jgi:hypothetical protein
VVSKNYLVQTTYISEFGNWCDSVSSSCAVCVIASNHPTQLVWFWLLLAVLRFVFMLSFSRLAD